MIFILGVLSLIQILVLPGVILLKLFNLRRGVIQFFVFAFGLSQIFNFLWVLMLTLLKINFPLLHYFLFAVEVGLFVWLYKEVLFTPIEETLKDWPARFNDTINSFTFFFQKSNQETSFSRIVKSIIAFWFFGWSITSLLWVSKILLTNWGTAFKLWDAVISWNRWATQWYGNVIPSPQRYSQLLPANFSITYSFLGNTDIQFFAKGFMPLFTIFVWVLMLDLAFQYKKPGIFIGIVITRYMTKHFLFKYIGEGYVDVALLFFSFLTVYALLKANFAEDDSTKTEYLYIGAVFAAGTALTKQNGLIIFTFYPLLAFLLVTGSMKHHNYKDRVRLLVKPVLIAIVVLLPWYAINEYRISIGLNDTNIEYLISADRHDGRLYLERFVRAVESLGKYAYLFPFVLLTLPLIQKKFRWVAIITIFPYTIIWAFLFSIFPRNLAMVFPFLGLSAGLGVQGMINLTIGFAEKLKIHHLKNIVYLLVLLSMIFSMNVLFTNEKIAEQQIEDQKQAMLFALNNKLYAYFDENDDYGPVMTSYRIHYLPFFENLYIHEEFAIYNEFYENFSAHPEVKYFLVWERKASKEVLAIITQFEEKGALEYFFENTNMKFYKVIDRNIILDSPPN